MYYLHGVRYIYTYMAHTPLIVYPSIHSALRGIFMKYFMVGMPFETTQHS
jgi:hypothetical protein